VSIPLTESREYNVIETDCSIGSIITTDGTNDPGIMQDGNDLLEGGDGADYFDCGDGLDVIIDFEPSKGDTHTNNCKDIREHL
jgi:hypothetical protein